MPTIWDDAVSNLQGRLKPHFYDLWFRFIDCARVDGKHIYLTAPNEGVREHFGDHFLPLVLDEIQRQTSERYSATIEVDPVSAKAADAVLEDLPSPGPDLKLREDTLDPPLSVPELLPRFTFDSFVVGPGNQLSHAAARAVAEQPGTRYNPLFIYGGVGLGKTHLLRAIGHELRQRHQEWQVTYVSGETFINEYIAAIRPSEPRGENRMEDFRRRYRHDCDVLLIDDIQFLAGKERTQDEFFHTFNSLYDLDKQIVLTSDRFPNEIDDLEERLRTRFSCGLVADIQPPDLETRSAIISRKAELDSIDLPREVALFLAGSIKSNVRELEGSLIRIAAHASLVHSPITIDLAREALKHIMAQDQSGLSMEGILKEVANYFHQKVSDLRGSRRHRSISWPRQIAMYFCYRLLQDSPQRASYPMVAQFFGGRDHTTVLSACRKVEKLRGEDRAVRDILDSIEQRLRK
jgi:chromosomal replication initiator protein